MSEFDFLIATDVVEKKKLYIAENNNFKLITSVLRYIVRLTISGFYQPGNYHLYLSD